MKPYFLWKKKGGGGFKNVVKQMIHMKCKVQFSLKTNKINFRMPTATNLLTTKRSVKSLSIEAKLTFNFLH